jgi:hypothetical protein
VPKPKASAACLCGSRVAAVALASASACFPRDDLADYSRTWANQPSAGGSAGDAGADAGEGVRDGGSAGAPGKGGPSRVDAGTLEPSDAGLLDAGAVDSGVDDGGVPPPVDAGSVLVADAAAPSLVAQCLALNGALEPGARNCFVVSSTTATWQGAVLGCDALGMQLAIITSGAQDDFIATLTPAAVWLGARDPAFFTFPAFANPTVNAYSWLDGTAVADINWAPGEPDDGVGEFCVEKSAQAGEPWFDSNCNDLALYVCQSVL